ncbi:hypothetical protein N9972_01660, partial [bacterium]|nr:hypothetical protein [bacterium]
MNLWKLKTESVGFQDLWDDSLACEEAFFSEVAECEFESKGGGGKNGRAPEDCSGDFCELGIRDTLECNEI